LRGGILYHDGQFDDTRYAISLLRTLEDLGGVAINYVEAVALLQSGGKTIGITARDREGDASFDLRAKVVINACGVFAEETLAMEHRKHEAMLSVSQGTHFVLPHSFMAGTTALMIPKTADGRVLFAIPMAWLDDRGDYGCGCGSRVCRAARSWVGEEVHSGPH